MQHSETTKKNDAVTKCQFERFLPNADLLALWKFKVKNFRDILDMPFFCSQDLISKFILF